MENNIIVGSEKTFHSDEELSENSTCSKMEQVQIKV